MLRPWRGPLLVISHKDFTTISPPTICSRVQPSKAGDKSGSRSSRLTTRDFLRSLIGYRSPPTRSMSAPILATSDLDLLIGASSTTTRIRIVENQPTLIASTMDSRAPPVIDFSRMISAPSFTDLLAYLRHSQHFTVPTLPRKTTSSTKSATHVSRRDSFR